VHRKWALTALLVASAALLAGCLNPGTVPVTPTLQNGTAAPGLWHTFGGTDCSWQRLRGLSGAPGDVIADSVPAPSGPRYVEIEGSDAGFQTQGCLSWVQADGPFDAPVGADANGQFGDGDYRVGRDIQPGTYESTQEPSCYWARLSGFTGEADDNTQVSFGFGHVVITADDVGFSTSGCGIWTKVA